MTTERDRIQHRADEDAQRVAKETRIDLDAFLALSGAARAARWRQFDHAAKADAVIQQLGRLGLDWTEELVARWIAKYDEKYALSPLDQAVEGALERMADEHQRSAERADATEERMFFRRWANAFRKALLSYRQGIRPEPTPSGALLIPSATRAGAVHQVSRDGRCTCEAQGRGCWHAALAVGLEVAADDMERFDDPTPTPTDLGQRLTAARAKLMDADSQHISVQARDAYDRASARYPNRPLYADRDAETMRRQALAEERAALLEQRARRSREAA